MITVLITAHNYGRFLDDSITSVLNQQDFSDPYEILVVDDGSTDDTRERVKKYESKITYLFKPNGGQASALNHGIAAAQGDIVCLLDADDLFLPNKLARIAASFQNDPALALAYHRLEEWHPATGQRRPWQFVSVTGDIRRSPEKIRLFVPQPTSAISFRKSLAAPLLPIPSNIRMLADCYLVALLPLLAPVLAIPETLSYYRIHGDNSYSQAAPQIAPETYQQRAAMWRIVIAEMQAWLKNNPQLCDESAARAFLERWDTFLEAQEFPLAPPGRLRFFRHLLRSYRDRAPSMGWKLALINFVDAVGALAFGYRHFPRWRDANEGLQRSVREILRGKA